MPGADAHANAPLLSRSGCAEFRDYFKDVYGPTIAAYRNVMEWEYLLLTARKA